MNTLFNSSQADFILVATTALNSYFEYLADFTDFSPKYTQVWGDNLRTKLDDVQEMPIEDARRAESEAIRVLLTQKNRQACNEWQKLKRYITTAYDESLVNIKLTAAGQNLYTTAVNENWSSAQMMYAAATKFITTNLATLTANNNMPPTFPAAFGTVVDDFKQLLSDYEDSKETIMVDTQNRLIALNDIFRLLMPMMLDGQEIFRDNEAVRKQFIFTDVLSRITGPGLAGLDGKVTDTVTNLPISGAVVKLFLSDNPGTEYLGSTNEVGDYLVNCPSGTYNVTVTAVGYNAHTMESILVSVGTVSRINVKLSLI